MSQTFSFSLLENGLDFLLSALLHLRRTTDLTGLSTDERVEQQHQLKYALLHVWSGIELILKERLRQEHWSLVFKDINGASLQSYESGDFQSITFKETVERLRGICSVSLPDDVSKQLKDLQRRRNKVEHFGAVDTIDAVIANVTSAAAFAIEFVGEQFSDSARHNEGRLYIEVMTVLQTCRAVLAHKLVAVQQEVMVGEQVITCVRCSQKALVIRKCRTKCLFCRYESKSSVAAAFEYAESITGRNNGFYESMDPPLPISYCPKCDEFALVTPKDGAYGRPRCFGCDETS